MYHKNKYNNNNTVVYKGMLYCIYYFLRRFGRGVSSILGPSSPNILFFVLAELLTSSSMDDDWSLIRLVLSCTLLELGLLLHPPLCRTLPKKFSSGSWLKRAVRMYCLVSPGSLSSSLTMPVSDITADIVYT